MSPPPSPQASRGLYETLLIVDGAPVELEAHLARLAGSARKLYGTEPPADLAADAETACSGIGLGRLRVEIVPDPSGGFAKTLRAAPIGPALPSR